MPAAVEFLRRRLKGLRSDKMARRFAGTAGLVMIVRLVSAASRYLVLVLLARWFTQEEYGYYGFVQNLVMFLCMVCSLGLSNGSIRFIGQYGARESPETDALTKGVAMTGTRVVFLVALIVFLIVALGVFIASGQGMFEHPWIYIAGLLVLPAYALADVQASSLRAFGKVGSAILPRDLFWRLLALPIAFALILWAPAEYRLIIFFLVSAAALYLIAGGQRYALWRAMPRQVRDRRAHADWPVWRKALLPMWITGMGRLAIQTLDVVIVGLFLSPAETALYFAASRTAGQVTFFLASSNFVAGPEVARLYHAGEIARLQKLLRIGAVIVFVPSLAIFLVAAFGSQFIMSLFGPDFTPAWRLLVILAFGQLINAGTGCVGITLTLTGHERKNAEIMITSSVLTIVLMLIIIPVLGSVGAAIATAAGLALWNIRLWLYARYKVGIDPSILSVFMKTRPVNPPAPAPNDD